MPRTKERREPPRRRKVLVVIDSAGWAYHRRALALQKFSPSDKWDVHIFESDGFVSGRCTVGEYSVVFLLDYVFADAVRGRLNRENPGCKLAVSFNADEHRRRELFSHVAAIADAVVCVSLGRYQARGSVKNAVYIPNGIDVSVFKPKTPIAERADRVLWLSSDKAAFDKGLEVIREIEVPLKKAGFSTDFQVCRNGDRRMDQWDMADRYNRAAYVLCLSKSEGTANLILEGAACGCVPVTTPVGQFVGVGTHGRDMVLVEPTAKSAMDGLKEARKNRESLSVGASETVRRFDYRTHAARYFDLFDRLVGG